MVLFLEGKRHDAGMLRMSGLLDQLEQYSNTTLGDPLCIYGDPAYTLRRHLQKPYQFPNLNARQLEFNRSMSSVRVSVEWIFGDIINYFKFTDFKKNLKIELSAVGRDLFPLVNRQCLCECGGYFKQTGIFYAHGNAILI